MTIFVFKQRRPLRRLILLCSLVLSLACLRPVLAHGGGAPQITDVPAGPYRLFAWSSPDPWRTEGAVHLTVAVTMVDAAGQVMPISDAVVTVRLTAESQSAPQMQLIAEPNPTATGFYEADGELPVAGAWRVEVVVSGVEGVGSGRFTTTVQPGGAFQWMIWAGVGIGIGVLALLGFLALRLRPLHANEPRVQRA